MLKKPVLIILATFFIFFDAHAAKCPQNIISLTLASDEILIDMIEDKSRISALTYLSTDSAISNIAERTEDIPKIHANIEQVISLDPDLVILASYTNQNFRKHLENTSIRSVFLNEFGSISSIKENIRLIGKAVCEEKSAERLISDMEDRLAEITSKIPSDRPAPRVLYYSASGNTAGKGSSVNEIIEKAGGINLAKEAGIDEYGTISLEYIIKTDPDIIVLSSYNPSDPDFPKDFISNSVLRNISAVRNDRVKIVHARYLISASHYIVNSVEDITRIFLESYWNDDSKK